MKIGMSGISSVYGLFYPFYCTSTASFINVPYVLLRLVG